MSHIKIKEETKALHKELDQLLLNKKIMSKEVTLKDYKLFLLAQFHVYAFLKMCLSSIDYRFYKSIIDRYSVLKIDLYKLNIEVDSISSLSFEKPEFDNDKSSLLGLQYVLEGSKHGAVYIKKHLKNQLDLSDDCFQFLSYTSTLDWKNIIGQLDHEKDVLNLKKGSIYAYNLFITSFKALSLEIDE